MKARYLIPVLGLASLLACSSAMAQNTGRWLVRAGPTWIGPNDDSGSVTGIPDSGVSVDDAWTLGLSFAYMATENVSVELLGVLPPTEHDLDGDGSISALGNIGDVTVLPPTLTVNYHFNQFGRVRPYVGVGFNYTYFYDADASSSLEAALGGSTDIDVDDSWGFAGHVGVDVDINEQWFANLGVWYIDISTEATLDTGGVKRSVDVDIDPWVVFLGVGMRF